MLEEAGIITGSLSERLKAMVGFRDVAVHDYRKLNLEVVRKIIDEHLSDFRQFSRTVLTMEQ